jgi:pyruvate dehydrogenase E1 component
LQRDGVDTHRYNLLNPGSKPKQTYAQQAIGARKGPAIAATDYVRLYSESIRPYIGDRRYVTLGTDGYGRSDFRRKLREFFEVNRYYVTIAALNALADDGTIDRKLVGDAIKKYGINPSKPNPVSV